MGARVPPAVCAHKEACPVPLWVPLTLPLHRAAGFQWAPAKAVHRRAFAETLTEAHQDAAVRLDALERPAAPALARQRDASLAAHLVAAVRAQVVPDALEIFGPLAVLPPAVVPPEHPLVLLPRDVACPALPVVVHPEQMAELDPAPEWKHRPVQQVASEQWAAVVPLV